MTLAEAFGFLGSGLVLLAFGMPAKLPLRLVAIGSSLAFVAYALPLGLTPLWLLHAILLPLNLYRLLGTSPPVADERRPPVEQRTLGRGAVLFRKGDPARHRFYILKGRLRLRDLDGTGDGACAGADLHAPGGRWSATAICDTECELLVVSEPARVPRPAPLRAPRRLPAASLPGWPARALDPLSRVRAQLAAAWSSPAFARRLAKLVRRARAIGPPPPGFAPVRRRR